jgi:hypothetical protein
MACRESPCLGAPPSRWRSKPWPGGETPGAAQLIHISRVGRVARPAMPKAQSAAFPALFRLFLASLSRRGGSGEAVSKHVMKKPQSKRRRRETDQPSVEAAQRPEPWVRNREKRALKGRNRFCCYLKTCAALPGLVQRFKFPGACAPGFAAPRFRSLNLEF